MKWVKHFLSEYEIHQISSDNHSLVCLVLLEWSMKLPLTKQEAHKKAVYHSHFTYLLKQMMLKSMWSVTPQAGVFLWSKCVKNPHTLYSLLLGSQSEAGYFFPLHQRVKKSCRKYQHHFLSAIYMLISLLLNPRQYEPKWWLGWAFHCKQYTMDTEDFSVQRKRTSGGCFTEGLAAPSLSHFCTCDVSSLLHLPLFRCKLLWIVKEYYIISSTNKNLV